MKVKILDLAATNATTAKLLLRFSAKTQFLLDYSYTCFSYIPIKVHFFVSQRVNIFSEVEYF